MDVLRAGRNVGVARNPAGSWSKEGAWETVRYVNTIGVDSIDLLWGYLSWLATEVLLIETLLPILHRHMLTCGKDRMTLGKDQLWR